MYVSATVALFWRGVLDLQAEIEAIHADPTIQRDNRVERLLAAFRQAVNRGEARAAVFDGGWKVNTWVKKGIALSARFGRLSEDGAGSAIDLDTLPRKRFSIEDGVRLTDSSCFIRDGVCISRGCAIMPHTMIQMGAFVGPQTVVDVGVSIGACAQIGARVHLNAGVRVHGHIQPLEMLPVIIGDEASIGANCVIGARVIIGLGAVIFPGMSLSGQTRLYDPAKRQRYSATDAEPLVVPPHAIVVPGVRATTAESSGDPLLGVQVGVIVGYTEGHENPARVLDHLLDN